MDLLTVTFTVGIETIAAVIMASISIIGLPIGVWKYNAKQLKNKTDVVQFEKLEEEVGLKVDEVDYQACKIETYHYIDKNIGEVEESVKDHKERTNAQFDQINKSLTDIYKLLITMKDAK